MIRDHQYGPSVDLRLSRVVPYLIKAGGYIGGILQPVSDLIPVMPTSHAIANPHGDSDPECPLMPAAQGGLLDNGILTDKAIELGGHAFFDGATNALTQIVATGSDYYTLSYVPTNPNWNGTFRKIGINVSGIPRTTSSATFGWTDYGQQNVTYRRGYYARSKPDPNFGSPSFGPDTPSDSQPDPTRKLISVSPRGNPGAPPVTPFAAAMGFGIATPADVQFTIQVTPAASPEALKPGVAQPKDNFLVASYRTQPYRNHRIHYWIDPQHLKFTRTSAGTFRDDLQFAAIIYGDDGLAINTISATAHIQASADDLETIPPPASPSTRPLPSQPPAASTSAPASTRPPPATSVSSKFPQTRSSSSQPKPSQPPANRKPTAES